MTVTVSIDKKVSSSQWMREAKRELKGALTTMTSFLLWEFRITLLQ